MFCDAIYTWRDTNLAEAYGAARRKLLTHIIVNVRGGHASHAAIFFKFKNSVAIAQLRRPMHTKLRIGREQGSISFRIRVSGLEVVGVGAREAP